MGRLIDAELAAKKLMVLAKEPDYQHEGEDWSVGLYMAESALDEIPTATVVEEIFEAIKTKCVDEDGYFLYGEFMNLYLDMKEKYGVK